MKTIHKHKLLIDKEWHTLDLPLVARILYVEYLVHERAVFMWAEVQADMNAETQPRRFRVFCTGDGVPDSAEYVGTTIDQYLPEAYHVYEAFDEQ